MRIFDLRRYYEKENKKAKEGYEKTLSTIQKIVNDAHKTDDVKNEYYHFFKTTGTFILKLIEYEKALDDDYFTTKDFEELSEANNAFFEEILEKNYNKDSYANPTYCVNIFGDKFGQLMCYLYTRFRGYVQYATYHKIFKMEEYNRLFINVFNCVKNNNIDYETLKRLITALQRKDRTEEYIRSLKEKFDIHFSYLKDIVELSDLGDLRYLFRYGRYISDGEIKTAKFLSNYPEDKIAKLSRQIVKAYIDGFKRRKRDMSRKTTVLISFEIGQERIVRQLINDLRKHNLETAITSASSTRVNKQYDYDHRFDEALYLEEELVHRCIEMYERACEHCKDILTTCSGMIQLGKFGEIPFVPENKEEYLKFTDEQQRLYQVYLNNIVNIQDRYFPQKEVSFTMVSLPSSEVGGDFEQIFEDILEINMLDTEVYERIQQGIIDALDKADYVRVKGRGTNQTDLCVKLHEIKNPAKETNFLNCGADMNIPVGEVFTSPQLRGTNGTLHVEEIFLNGLKFIGLKLVFKDGYIENYSCKNFEKEKDNKKYIEENLLFPHNTLPLGEFAIGTNTLAYVIASKHNILSILPVLIIEKMGPHFAIGDTCFAYSEENAIFNRFDQKEVIARENEKTALRKTKTDKAYVHRHIDITLPYESIDFILAVTKDNEEIDIIKNGRFFLPGTEELNKPLQLHCGKREAQNFQQKSQK